MVLGMTASLTPRILVPLVSGVAFVAAAAVSVTLATGQGRRFRKAVFSVANLPDIHDSIAARSPHVAAVMDYDRLLTGHVVPTSSGPARIGFANGSYGIYIDLGEHRSYLPLRPAARVGR